MKIQILIVAALLGVTSVSAQGKGTDASKLKTNEKVEAAIKLQSPQSGKEFIADEAKKTITFRWTPLVPKPKEGVTYRLKVWQLMQGQNSTQAMRTNKPFVTKDVMDITQTAVSSIYTGPCKPPYLCDFIWTVEAIAADGKPITDKGTQEVSSFSIEKSK